jgi:hypothetical protein
MKKTKVLLIAGLLVMLASVSFAESFQYASVRAESAAVTFDVYSDFPGQAVVTVKQDGFKLFGVYAIFVAPEALSQLEAYRAKYEEWSKLAKEKGVEVAKPIGTFPAKSQFYFGEKWQWCNDVDATLGFISMKDKASGKIITVLVLDVPELTAADNSMESNKFDASFFTGGNVPAFFNALTSKSLDAAAVELKKKEDSAALFN